MKRAETYKWTLLASLLILPTALLWSPWQKEQSQTTKLYSQKYTPQKPVSKPKSIDSKISYKLAATDKKQIKRTINKQKAKQKKTKKISADLIANKENALREYYEDWDFDALGLEYDDIAPWLGYPPPDVINYHHENGMRRIENPNKEGARVLKVEKTADANEKPEKILQIGDERGVEDLANRRDQNIKNDPPPPPIRRSRWQKLGENEFEIVSFQPGKQDLTDAPIQAVPNPWASAQGPDFSYQEYDEETNDLNNIARKTVSFGHRGVLVLKVAQNGWILDREGADFVIFENAILGGRGRKGHFELAYVEVSKDNKTYHRFPCDPHSDKQMSCAGAVTTLAGGDKFNLGALNLDKIRYIRLVDPGNNYHYPPKEGEPYNPHTTGFDLDAIHLKHAYKKKAL